MIPVLAAVVRSIKNVVEQEPECGEVMKRQTITHSVRMFCLECQGNSPKAVRECSDASCALWPYRLPDTSASSAMEMGGRPEATPQDVPLDFACSAESCAESSSDPVAAQDTEEVASRVLTPQAREAARRIVLRAVRRHCMACAASRGDVRDCAAREKCGLWSYRFGVRPETYRAVRQRFLGPKILSLLTL